MTNPALIRKYNVPGPRYTSYPTVPHWHNHPSRAQWSALVRRRFLASNAEQGLSLYVHLPYCESLCTYCGCNKRITKNHAVELPYIRTVLREWALYLECLEGERPRIRELHLGGGTPTFFAPSSLALLLDGLFAGADRHPEAELSFEAHPGSTTPEHLQRLYDYGFRRLSLGIQDFDPAVQAAVHRIQSFEQVRSVTELARRIGYTSVNYDLIYGLPHQKPAGVEDTLTKVGLLRPERIAFYGYAHVPWKSRSQRGFSEADLPDGEEKRALYELGKLRLEDMGYIEIGMDHFALPHDPLYARLDRLHRNFMGYTVGKTDLMLGLGVSAISDAWWGFVQNEKEVEAYTERVHRGELPLLRGHLLDSQDELLRRLILDVICRFQASWTEEQARMPVFQNALLLLQPLADDGLVLLQGNSLSLPPHAKPFVRNVCMCFDAYLQASEHSATQALFSKTV